MATNAQIGKGIQFLRGNGASPQTFQLLEEVVDISGFGFSSALIEVTHMQSLAKEYILDLKDGKQFTVTINEYPDNPIQHLLTADGENRTERNFKILYPSNLGSWQFIFSGLVLDVDTPATPGGVQRKTFTIKVTGDIVRQNLP